MIYALLEVYFLAAKFLYTFCYTNYKIFIVAEYLERQKSSLRAKISKITAKQYLQTV